MNGECEALVKIVHVVALGVSSYWELFLDSLITLQWLAMC